MKDAVFRTLIKRERLRLVRYVRSLLKETAEMDAEDIVHDVLVKLLERPGSASPIDDMTSYVYRAARNRMTDLARTRKPMVSLDTTSDEIGTSEIELLQDVGPGALEVLQSLESEQELFDALSRLSEIERRVVIAHEFEGTPFKELAIHMQIPQNTLLSHKARALKKLKEHFLNSK